jgi:hypothetical protein
VNLFQCASLESVSCYFATFASHLMPSLLVATNSDDDDDKRQEEQAYLVSMGYVPV